MTFYYCSGVRVRHLWLTEYSFNQSQVKNKIWSDCTKVSSVQRPIKGNAILFFTLHPNASPDESSSHARCPVLEGEMWCAAKFFQIREVKKEKISTESVGDECTDEDEDCPHWAAKGECQRNPLFMVGSPDYYGTCRKSCQACWLVIYNVYNFFHSPFVKISTNVAWVSDW